MVVRCNQRYAEIFGYDKHEQLVGVNGDTLHPNRAAFRALGRAAYPVLTAGQTYREDRLMRRRCASCFGVD